MNIGIIQFPGTNCQRETRMAAERAGMQPHFFLWNEDISRLRSFDGYILAGGFSYEDRSRSGIIAALDPIIPVLREESEKGKPVLGICNGAQVLVESGMVPNMSQSSAFPEAALAANKRVKDSRIIGTGYYNASALLRAEFPDPKENPWYVPVFTSRFSAGECISVPSAHGEGRFVFPEEIAQAVNRFGLIPFRYADSQGRPADEFPANPNGSQEQAAALTNVRGNVMAVMPHPERTSEGDKILLSMADYIKAQKGKPAEIPNLLPRPLTLPEFRPYREEPKSERLVIRQIITDNHAVTVESTLNSLEIPVSVLRHVYWEITIAPETPPARREEIRRSLHESGELYNSNKEEAVSFRQPEGSLTLLVLEHDDIAGKKTCQSLRSWFACPEITNVTKGILWTLTPAGAQSAEELVQKVSSTHILMNPHAYRGYTYAE